MKFKFWGKKKMGKEEIKDPEGFTCGKCKKVVPYNKGLKCPDCDETKEEE